MAWRSEDIGLFVALWNFGILKRIVMRWLDGWMEGLVGHQGTMTNEVICALVGRKYVMAAAYFV